MIIAILVGVLLYMVIGMVYYSPKLFGNVWVKLLKVENPDPKYGVLSMVTVLSVVVLSIILVWTGAESALDGFITGLGLGVIVTLAYSKDFIFGLGHQTLHARNVCLIAAGYHLIALPIIATVIMLFL